jgi:hypothetical protein
MDAPADPTQAYGLIRFYCQLRDCAVVRVANQAQARLAR